MGDGTEIRDRPRGNTPGLDYAFYMRHAADSLLPTASCQLVAMIVNRQTEITINLPAIREFARRLRKSLKMGRRAFDVSFVGDREITRLNKKYRRKPQPTDVLSFPSGIQDSNFKSPVELKSFLGDIVISAPMAKRNAALDGHSTMCEIRWLIIHGALHLLGYDHETDKGEMKALELEIRETLQT